MSNDNDTAQNGLSRVVGGTEYSWCQAVPGGTGITVLALLVSKQLDLPNLQNTLRDLQISHPILNTKLHYDPTAKTFSFLSHPSPAIEIQPFDPQSTAQILQHLRAQQTPRNDAVSDFHLLLERELNRNSWSAQNDAAASAADDVGVFFASLYGLGGARWALVLRLHTAACDRTAAAALLRGLMAGGGGGAGRGFGQSGEGILGIEELVPKEKSGKAFWARGVDVLGYSLNAFRLSHCEFRGPSWPRGSQVVRLRIAQGETRSVVDGCKSREIKLSTVLAAAALIAARSSKNIPNHQKEKYGVVTLIDCRSILEPPLSNQHLGFYHSAILNTHDMTGAETLWGLATRLYSSFANAKNSNKHFTDMSDLNFLMCKAIQNPSLTPSSSLRTAFVSIFEDPVVDQSDEKYKDLGLEDYIGCSSVHGVGPSIAVFDTIRDGCLDAALVYPSPLHSREQMQEIVDRMEKVLVDCCTIVPDGS